MLSLTRRAAMTALAAAAGNLAAQAGAEPDRRPALPLTGVNLAGAEFGALLGNHGREYLYPTLDNAHYYARLGFNLIRLPFKWERLEPDLGHAFDPAELGRLATLVEELTGSGLHVILDPHNFARRRLAQDGWGSDHLIGSAEVPAARFAEFWNRLAVLFRGNERVIFGLMNEPAGLSATAWLTSADAALAAIRDGGAMNLVLVPGVAYSGAHAWIASGSTVMAGLKDPLGRFAFEVHQYFDRDSSGRSSEAVSPTIGSERLAGFTAWARRHGFKAVLAEFNGGRNAAGLAALDDICRTMAASPDVWLGWAAWAGGPRWPQDDIFNLEPMPGGDAREQTRVLVRYTQQT